MSREEIRARAKTTDAILLDIRDAIGPRVARPRPVDAAVRPDTTHSKQIDPFTTITTRRNARYVMVKIECLVGAAGRPDLFLVRIGKRTA
jgi:hypothetical protein